MVTGAGGFVGRHLLPRLAADGHDVSGCDLEVDVTDPAAVGKAVAACAPEALVHLAALSSVARSHDAAAATYRVNYLGTRNALEAAAQAPARCRVLVVGSGDEYGTAAPGAPPFREDAPLRPRSPYARTKAAADLLAGAAAARGLDVVRVRSFNHTGPGQSETFVAASFARQCAEIAEGLRKPLVRVGNLESVRDFLDVEDVVDAYTRLLDPGCPAGVYNVASGRGRRVGELLDGLLDLAGVKAEIVVDAQRLRPADHSVGDATRLRTVTGWSPRVPFRTSLERLMAHWRSRVRDA
jgi:GDP-4-dehydro-6-deoxy-D-mannose reductase